ncbi:hypothetical protein OVA03_12735 [Asticcacaulis sp. SL142]|uniref:hypothetical protein n=1 Tax=Asticcacaulis sp. SL142 TaxID=2995155 RepID=UPI00226D1424|nr:hypothetical protein [Asticcacaulis sp. SL142]WAC47562.1 hypothetical protein OVA03_12735 [Asticcacaulis sp. SL142]
MEHHYQNNDDNGHQFDAIEYVPAPRRKRRNAPYPAHKGLGLSPSMLAMGCMLLGAGVMWGLEMYAPDQFKPSTFSGANQSRVEAAVEAAIAQQKAELDTYVKKVELVSQQNAEQYKTRLMATTQFYDAAYLRARVYAEATTRIQQQYITVRLQTKQQLLAPDIAVANLSRFWGYGKNYLAAGSGDAAMRYSEDLGNYVLDELTKTAMSGTTLKVEGWDDSLPPPYEVQAYLMDIEPIPYPAPPEFWTHEKRNAK